MTFRFKWTDTFTAGSFAVMGLIAATQLYFHHRQSNFLESVHAEEIRWDRETQDQAALRTEDLARRQLLKGQESANALLARLLSHALGASDFAPFLAQVEAIHPDRCRWQNPDARAACLATQAAAIRALPGWAALDAKVRSAVRDSAVVKVQIQNLHGITFYSTEPAQIGRDRSTTPGWIGAARHGRAFSELQPGDPAPNAVDTQEMVVSHLPMATPGTERAVGVFEVHADVTPFARQVRMGTKAARNAAHDNAQRASEQAHGTQEQFIRSGRIQFVVIVSLLALLYLMQLAIVRRSQDAIHQQAREGQAQQLRLVHNEKMATVGQMVASVTHQLKTPLAFSKSNVFMAIQSLDCMAGPIERSAYMLRKETAGDSDITVPHDLNDPQLVAVMGRLPEAMHAAQDMLGDVLIGMDQMSELVNHLHDFTRLDPAKPSLVHLNQTLSTVMYIASSVIPGKVRLVEAFEELPPLTCNASQLHQVFLNLIVNAAQAIQGSGTVTVATRCDREHITVCIMDTGCGIPNHILPRIYDPYFTTKPSGEGTGLGLTIAKSIVADHGGQIVVDTMVGVGSRFKVMLPLRFGL